MFKRIATVSTLEKLDIAQTAKNMLAAKANSDEIAFDYDPENFTYFRCRAITANETNGNGDRFPDDELSKYYKTFVGVGLYKDHDSDSIDKAIGKVLHAEYIRPKEGNPYVETICAVDKKLAPDLARRVESGIATSVSMGCSVREAECSVCNNIAHNPNELCQHMMPGFGVKGRKGTDGETIYEVNRGIQFTELSLVTVPADPTARIFEVYAELDKRFAKVDREKLAEALYGLVITAKPEDLPAFEKFIKDKGVSLPGSFVPESEAKPIVDGLVMNTDHSGVAKKDELVERKMGLAISYIKGSSLDNSYLVATDSKSTYRVAAADVLPLVVQSAISAGDPKVVTPEGLILDLTQKYSSVGDFKAWAKRRRRKNRRACDKKEAEAKKADSVETAMPQKTEEAAAPRVDGIKAAASDNGRNEMDIKEKAELEKKAAETPETPAAAPVAEAPATEAAPEAAVAVKEAAPVAEKGDIFAAFEALRKYVESKLDDLNKREAVKTESNVGKKYSDGDHGDKSGAAPAAMQEIARTEAPKGHMDKGAALKAEAMNKDWSVNPKELEAGAKLAKSDGLNLPPTLSVDRKEASSEAVTGDGGGKAGATVKKYFNRLPAGGPGEAPVSMDLKSGQDPEKEMLRKALQEEKAEKERLLEKERLQTIADKVYEVVTAMKEKNLLAEGSEDAVIDTLTARFADIKQLENVKTLVAHLSIRKAAAPEGDAELAENPVGTVVPQVFETVETTEDAVQKMASIWNA